MFSCLLFENTQSQDVKECDINFDITGWIGEGHAIVKFHPAQRPLTNTVLYIPTLLCHKETGCKTQLSLVSCSLKWLNSDVLLKHDDLSLSRSHWKNHDNLMSQERCKMAYHKVKADVESKVFSLAGALSPNDVLLFIGNIDSGVELQVNVSFVLRIHPHVTDTAVSSIVAVMMTQCDLIRLTANITATEKIRSVNHLDSGHSNSSRLSSCINDTRTSCTIISNVRLLTPLGMVVALSSSTHHTVLKSSCLSLLLKEPVMVPHGNGIAKAVHGIQMLSTLPSTGGDRVESWGNLTPCEMLFMVDCSGSMCGEKIHSASQALMIAVKSLPEGSKFNIVAFGSKYRFLFQSSMEASDYKYVEKAVQFSNQLQASLGGTELLIPLRWLLKKPLMDGLQRELFLITDGGVPNVTDVLNVVRRYKHQTRCHSFALGPDISSELMSGLAIETNGSFIGIDEDARLQSKVMEVVKKVIQPSITKVTVSWPPPTGYETGKPFPPPSSCWSTSSPHTHFTTLTKDQHALKNGCSTLSITPPTITGFLTSERIQSTATLDHENVTPLSSRGRSLLRNAAWAKMQSLYDELLECSRRKRINTALSVDEPPTKKRKVTDQPSTDKEELVDEITSISLESGVSFYPYTHFVSSTAPPPGIEGDRPCAILPWNGPVNSIHKRRSFSHASSSRQQQMRKRKRHHCHATTPSMTSSSSTWSSLAKRSVASVCSTFKTVINIASFGFISMETNDPLLEGERIEDQVYYQNKHERIHWNQHNKLVLPNIYYKSYSANQSSGSNVAQSGSDVHQSGPSAFQSGPSAFQSGSHDIQPGSDAVQSGSNVVQSGFGIPRTHSSSSDSDQNYEMISPETQFMEIASSIDNDSNDEVVYDNTDNTQDTAIPDYMALVQLQLPSGGWPLIPSLARATGSSVGYIRSLPSKEGVSTTSTTTVVEDVGNVWASLMAIGCLRTHFRQFEVEWSVLALKGRDWVNRNHKETIPVTLCEAEAIVETHFSNK